MGYKLFIYGTLADPEVQKDIFGRTTEGIPDVLNGYGIREIEIDGERYPTIIPSETERVMGTMIDITERELKKSDDYETNAYKRERVVLESGAFAWVYMQR